jgi:hypothetical protein
MTFLVIESMHTTLHYAMLCYAMRHKTQDSMIILLMQYT